MAIARGISETSIVFDGNNGHNHDGTAENGSLIDTSKYSIYDFSPTKINTADNQRSIRQDNNINAFNNKIAEIVNNLILRPAGIVLQEETLNGNYIIANTITSNQIAANSITANEIAANSITTNELTSDILQSSNYSYTSGNFSNAGTFFDLADGSITSKNFAIDNSGNAYFTGQINATSGTFSGNITSSATISGGTLTGTTITGSTLSSGDPFNDGVSITSTQVKINTTGTSSSAKLVFNTNAGSGTNYITGDKAFQIETGGSSKTFINMGNTSGSGVGRVYAGALYFETYNAEVTRLTASVIGQNRFGNTVRVSDYYGVDISLSDELYAGRVTVTGDLNVFGTKNFSIQHPLDESRYLVHAAVEGPTADLIYRGTSNLENGSVEVELPRYFEAASKLEGRTVLITPKISGDGSQCNMAASSIENGKFLVVTQNCIDNCYHEFDWVVFAVRGDVETIVEPLKSEYNVKKEKETYALIDPALNI